MGSATGRPHRPLIVGVWAMTLALSGCALSGKWVPTGTTVLQKQLERSTDVARGEDRYQATVDADAAALRLRAARRSHCRAVEVRQEQDAQRWQSDRCPVGYGFAGMLLSAAALFGTTGAVVTAEGVAEDGRADGDAELARSRTGVGAALLTVGVAGIVLGIVEALRQSKARRQCRTPRRGPVRTVRTKTTYACGDKPLAGATLTLGVPAPRAKKTPGDDDDDDDAQAVYRTLSVQTDATGTATVPLARLLAAAWASRLGGHLKVTREGRTTRVDLPQGDAQRALCSKLVATRTLRPLVRGGDSHRLDFAAAAQTLVRRLTVSCTTDQRLTVALKGKVLAVDWKGTAVARAALERLAQGQPQPVGCEMATPSVLQLVVPAGGPLTVTVSPAPAAPTPAP